jgi:uncharacterized protein (DUF697 family)
MDGLPRVSSRASSRSETATMAASTSDAAPSVLPPQAPVEPAADERRTQALAIVDRHAVYCAVGGIIPLPIANFGSVAALLVHMVKRLSDLYGVPYERDRARAFVIGALGGVLPSGVGMVTATTLGLVVPGSGLIGLAACSATALACTRRIGAALVDRFESGATLHDVALIDWR